MGRIPRRDRWQDRRQLDLSYANFAKPYDF